MGPQETFEWRCRIVFGTYERTICGFDVHLSLMTKKLVLKPVFIVPAHLGCLKALAIGGTILASGGNDEVIKLFDLKRKKELGSLHQHEGSITTMDFYKSSHMLSGGEDGLICVWRTRDWECLKVFKGHRGAVNCVSIHASGRVALSVGKDGSLCMWDLLKGRLAFKKKLPRVAEKISFSHDGMYFAMVCESVVFLYKTDSVQMIHEIKNDERIHAIHWYKDVHIWTAGEDKTIRSFHVLTGVCLMVIQGHATRLRCLSIVELEDRDYLISGSSDGVIRIWDITSASRIEQETIVHGRDDCVAEYNTTCRLTCVASTAKLSLFQENAKESQVQIDISAPAQQDIV